MSDYVFNANLPEKRVSCIIAGKMPESAANDLKKCGIEILEIEKNRILDERVSTHTDLQCLHLGDNRILVEKNQQNLINSLKSKGLNIDLFSIEKGNYPFDCIINAAVFDKNVICRYDIIEDKLKRYFCDNNYRIIDVNQGYSKCSVCIVDGNSIITEDESIKNTCEKQGIDVLLIRKGYVKLDGYGYGFIGGASFKISKSELAFIGRVESHPDYTDIKKFAQSKGISLLSLGECELTDIGSVIPITE